MKFFYHLIINSLQNKTLSRILQDYAFSQMKITKNGDIIEFGTSRNSKKRFSKYVFGKNRFFFADKIKNKDSFVINLEKKNNLKKKFDLILIFNVVEHIYDIENSFLELKKLLKKRGKIIGSTPFLFRVHYAPKDYHRPTKQFYENILKRNGFKNITITELGFGPFTTCYSILSDYLKIIPIFPTLILIFCIILDKFLNLFIKTPLKQIYPISYIFSCDK